MSLGYSPAQWVVAQGERSCCHTGRTSSTWGQHSGDVGGTVRVWGGGLGGTVRVWYGTCGTVRGWYGTWVVRYVGGEGDGGIGERWAAFGGRAEEHRLHAARVKKWHGMAPSLSTHNVATSHHATNRQPPLHAFTSTNVTYFIPTHTT
jgi:hypothetical protein